MLDEGAWGSISSTCDGQDADESDDDEEFEGFTQADVEEVQRKMDTSPDEIRQWLTIDDDCPVFEHATDEEIIANVTGSSHASGDISADETDVADDDDDVIEPPPKVAEAIRGLECALAWLETQDVDYVKVLHMRNMLDYARSKRETGFKQLKLDKFFQRS